MAGRSATRPPHPVARTWLLYLAACVLTFEHGNFTIHQVVAVRQGEHGASSFPLTREPMAHDGALTSHTGSASTTFGSAPCLGLSPFPQKDGKFNRSGTWARLRVWTSCPNRCSSRSLPQMPRLPVKSCVPTSMTSPAGIRPAATDEEIDASLREDPSIDLALPSGVFLVARQRDAVLGCAGLRMLPERIGEVKRLFVAPAARGIGLGARLMGELERLARGHGLSVLRLDTRHDLGRIPSAVCDPRLRGGARLQ